MGGINWVVSFPKSGNTWMRAFVANVLHQMRNPGAEPLSINGIGYYAPGHNGGMLYQPYLDKPFAEAKVSEVSALRAQVQRDLAERLDSAIFLKSHFPRSMDVFGHKMIDEDAMNAAIYIVRDPRDVVLSYRSHMGLETVDQAIRMLKAGAVAGLGKNPWRAHELYGNWADHVRSWLKLERPDVVLVRYEDMLADPFNALGATIRRAGVMADTWAIWNAVEATRFDRMRSQEEESGFRENVEVAKDKFFRRGVAGEWRDELTPRQVADIEDAFGGTMQRLGYPMAERRETGERNAWTDPAPGKAPYQPDWTARVRRRARLRGLMFRTGCRLTGRTIKPPMPALVTPQVHLASAFADDKAPELPDAETAQEIADRFDEHVATLLEQNEDADNGDKAASTDATFQNSKTPERAV